MDQTKKNNDNYKLTLDRNGIVLTLSNRNLHCFLVQGDSNLSIMLSLDLYQSAACWQLPHTFGKEKPDMQYTGGAKFVDHVTKLTHHNHQFTTTASETIHSKHKFEQFFEALKVKLPIYTAGDNNLFHLKEWKPNCTNSTANNYPSRSWHTPSKLRWKKPTKHLWHGLSHDAALCHPLVTGSKGWCLAFCCWSCSVNLESSTR